ncbi:MAG: FecR family protein [Spirochaetales bacterium]|jgi:hypothetical protein|nr:FecR family protein [Spirochaetales bacterium]
MKKLRTDREKAFCDESLVRLLCAGLVFFFFVFPAAAQSEAVAILEYCDYPDQIKIIDSDGFEVGELYFGMDIGRGDTIRTENTAAEIRLTRNSSVIRLAPHTSFRIDSLEGFRGDADNRFSLLSGKIRNVVSSTTRGKYLVETPSAVCEAYEADFSVSVTAGALDAAAVRKGRAAFTKKETLKTITITEGLAADTFAGVFEPQAYPPEKIEEIFYDLEFVMLDPDILIQPVPEAPAPVMSIPAPQKDTGDPEYPEEGPEFGSRDWLLAFMREHVTLGAELAAITLDRKTYAKFVVRPGLALGRFRLGLYLPFMFSGDLLSPSDEYHPQGNDEWDFGKHADQSSASDAGRKDFLRDLVLKIHFVEYGKPGDAVFLNAGSFRDITLGHGSLVYKYANDTDFPAVRRVGVYAGADAGIAGFEAMTADLAEADIMAGRVFVRPFPAAPLALGFSVAADTHPVFVMSDMTKKNFPLAPGDEYRVIDPALLGFALDADLPLWKDEGSAMTFFADVATLIPYLRQEYAGMSGLFGKTEGFLFDSFYDGSFAGRFRNYGLSGGLFGNIRALDYRLEYRQYQGLFRPGFFGPNYDRFRSRFATETLTYLANPDEAGYSLTTLAVYGELGFTLFDKLHFSAGLLAPAEKDAAGLTYSDNDYMEFRFRLAKGLIPVPVLDKFSLMFEYTQEGFAPLARNRKKTDFVDAYTVLKGEIAYSVSDAVELAFSVTTVTLRDTEGFIIYDAATYEPQWAYACAMEARVRF